MIEDIIKKIFKGGCGCLTTVFIAGMIFAILILMAL